MNRESAHCKLVPDDSDDVPIVRYVLGGQARHGEDTENSATVIFYCVVVGFLTVLAQLLSGANNG